MFISETLQFEHFRSLLPHSLFELEIIQGHDILNRSKVTWLLLYDRQRGLHSINGTHNTVYISGSVELVVCGKGVNGLLSPW